MGMALGKIGKVAIAAALFCGVAAVGAFVTKADRDPRPEAQTITEFGGVRLGMSPTDVTLALGRPFASSKIEIDGNGRAHLIYVYSKGKNDDHSLDITFHGANSSSIRAAVVCEHGGFSSLLGFDKFSREQDILRVLGNPTFTSIRGDGLEKTISYSQWNASFKIALGKVMGLCIHQGNFIQYDKEVSPGAPTPAI
jgi:hypothetical protein